MKSKRKSFVWRRLDEVEKLVIAEETSKNTQKESKSDTANLNRLSAYKQQNKFSKDADKSCRNCGEKCHRYRDLKQDDKNKNKLMGKNVRNVGEWTTCLKMWRRQG